MNFRFKYKYFTIATLIAASFADIWAQAPMSLYYMETIPQSNQLNPAMAPRANCYIALPSAFVGFQSDVAFKDALQKVDNNKWATPLSKSFDYDKLYDKLGKAMNMNLNANVGLLGLGFRAGRDYLSFNLSEKAVFQTGLPTDFFKIADRGFPDGSNYDFSTMRVKAYSYLELSFGYSRELTDKLTVGMHFKPLFGQVAAMTDIETMSMNIGQEQYDIAVLGNIYTSLPMDVYSKPNEYPDSIVMEDLEADDIVDRYLKSLKNPGLAIDLGAEYKYNEEWSFSAAINNIGFINWKEDLNSLSTSGKYNYVGPNITAENWDTLENAMEDIGDELEKELTHNAANDQFNTGLTPYFYLGAEYKVNHAISFGALSKSTFQKQSFRQEFNFSANYNPYRFMTFNMSLNTRIKGATYLGMGLAWYMGPLQFYVLTDHIPFYYSTYKTDGGDEFPLPERLKDVNLMLGFNLVFGSKGFRDKPMIGKNR